jgi:hypothetical protein
MHQVLAFLGKIGQGRQHSGQGNEIEIMILRDHKAQCFIVIPGKINTLVPHIRFRSANPKKTHQTNPKKKQGKFPCTPLG